MRWANARDEVAVGIVTNDIEEMEREDVDMEEEGEEGEEGEEEGVLDGMLGAAGQQLRKLALRWNHITKSKKLYLTRNGSTFLLLVVSYRNEIVVSVLSL